MIVISPSNFKKERNNSQPAEFSWGWFTGGLGGRAGEGLVDLWGDESMKTVAFETKEALRDALDDPSSEFATADIVGQASIEADSELKKKTAF